jgi:hypothetical protein
MGVVPQQSTGRAGKRPFPGPAEPGIDGVQVQALSDAEQAYGVGLLEHVGDDLQQFRDPVGGEVSGDLGPAPHRGRGIPRCITVSCTIRRSQKPAV